MIRVPTCRPFLRALPHHHPETLSCSPRHPHSPIRPPMGCVQPHAIAARQRACRPQTESTCTPLTSARLQPLPTSSIFRFRSALAQKNVLPKPNWREQRPRQSDTQRNDKHTSIGTANLLRNKSVQYQSNIKYRLSPTLRLSAPIGTKASAINLQPYVGTVSRYNFGRLATHLIVNHSHQGHV